MAAAIQFDTLDYARKLETAGVAAPLAEVQARALAEALSRAVATPDDLKVLESNLGTRFAAVESRLTVVESRLGIVESRLDAKIDGVWDRLDAKIDAVSKDLDAKIDAVSKDLNAKIEALRTDLNAKIEALRTDLIGRFQSVRTELELSLGGKIDKLAGTVDTLKWLFGLTAALNIAIFVRLVLYP